MRRPLVIKLLAGFVLLLALIYAAVRLDNAMAIRRIDTPPPPPAEAAAPSAAPAEPSP